MLQYKRVKMKIMVTQEQYESAKKIIEQWEHEQELEGWDDEDDFDERDWEEEEQERRIEEDSERAATCTCGAWVFNSKGMPVHIADCYCGAE